MKLDMKAGLGPGHTVSDGVQAPLPKGTQPPQFSAHVCCGQMAGLIKMPLVMEVGLGPGHIVRWGPSSPKGAQPPNFWPMSIVAKRSPISGTAEHLSQMETPSGITMA